MRLFIAIPLSDEMRRSIRDVQEEFRRQGVRGNYSPAENLHITLAFIGEHDDPDAVLDAVQNASFAPFDLMMDKIGCFGDLWWTGLSGSEALQALVRKLRRELSDAEIPFDRKKFKAHITFLRRAYVPGGGKITPVEIESVSMRVDHVSLMLSTRGKNGMIYTELGTVSSS